MKKVDRQKFMDAIDRLFVSELETASKEKVIINLETNVDGKGKCGMKVTGNSLSILIALAGLTNQILEETNTSKQEFELLRKYVGTMEVK